MFKVRQGLRETEYMPINPGTEQHSLLLLNYKLTNIRPEVMCGIWYRESNFKLINNPFQFDPPLPVSQQEEILNAYGANHLTGAARDVALATGFLEHKCVIPNEIKGLAPNQPILADAYYGYNGRAFGKAYENSPYVYNGYDDHHFPMTFIGTEPDPKNPKNRIKVTIEDRRPGALVVYLQLMNLNLWRLPNA